VSCWHHTSRKNMVHRVRASLIDFIKKAKSLKIWQVYGLGLFFCSKMDVVKVRDLVNILRATENSSPVVLNVPIGGRYTCHDPSSLPSSHLRLRPNPPSVTKFATLPPDLHPYSAIWSRNSSIRVWRGEAGWVAPHTHVDATVEPPPPVTP
jgi:hypothetical protein